MIRRGRARTLRQFFEFATKHVIDFKSVGNFPCDISVVCSARMPVGFLKKDNVRIRTGKEFDNAGQLRTASYVPTHDAKC